METQPPVWANTGKVSCFVISNRKVDKNAEKNSDILIKYLT